MLALWFSVCRCERTTYTQTVLRPVALHGHDDMGEEVLHPDRQPAGAAQQGERGERSSGWPLTVGFLAFLGITKGRRFASPLWVCESRERGKFFMEHTVIIQPTQVLVVWKRWQETVRLQNSLLEFDSLCSSLPLRLPMFLLLFMLYLLTS